MKFTFTDKASYLSWRQEWKDNYAQLSTDIRKRKRSCKQFLRTYEHYEGNAGFKARRLISKQPNPEYGKYSEWQLGGLQLEATAQLEILKEAKALSWILKQAVKDGQPVPQPEMVPPVVVSQPVSEQTPKSSLASRAFSAMRSAIVG